MKEYAFSSNLLIQKLIAFLLLIAPTITFTPPKEQYVLPLNYNGYTAMHEAALRNDVATIKALAIAYRKEINRPSAYNHNKEHTFKDTPAHIATFSKSWAALSTLIAFGADLCASNAENKIPSYNVANKDKDNYLQAIRQGALRKEEFQKPLAPKSVSSQTTKDETKCAQSQTNRSVYASIETQTDLQEEAIFPPSYHETKRLLNPEAPCFFPQRRSDSPYDERAQDASYFERLSDEIAKTLYAKESK